MVCYLHQGRRLTPLHAILVIFNTRATPALHVVRQLYSLSLRSSCNKPIQIDFFTHILTRNARFHALIQVDLHSFV